MKNSLDLRFIGLVFIKSICSLLILYIIFLAGYSFGIEIPVLLTISGGFLLFKIRNLPFKLILPPSVFLISALLSAVYSINSKQSYYQVWIFACAFVIFLIGLVLNHQFQLKRTIIFTICSAGIGLMIFSWADAWHWYQTYRSALPQGPLLPGVSYRLNGGNTIAAFYSPVSYTHLTLP